MSDMTITTILRGIALSVFAAAALPLAAQLHENISVEGKYVPEVIRADRVNTFPKALRQTLTTSPLEYEQAGVATAFTPSLLTMPATGWRADRFVSDRRGYLEAGIGSYANSTLSAGYRFIDDASTLFGARLQFNSTSGWKRRIDDFYQTTVKQERYDGSLGLYGSHVVKGYGRFDASLDWHSGEFNYYGIDPELGASSDLNPKVDAPTQTLTDVALRLGWRSLVTPATSVAYHGALRMRYFGYRAFYESTGHKYMEGDLWKKYKGSRETNIGLEGGLRFPWDTGSSIGLDAKIDAVLLSNDKNLVADGILSEYGGDNYGMVTLTPYYRFTQGLLDIKLGADIDIAAKAGEEGDRYPAFHIAPDVRFALQTGQVGLYLNLLGGSELNTLAHLHELDYYGIPLTVSTRPTFTPIDAAFGVNLGPFSGFSLGIEGRYRKQKGVPFGGWYQWMINEGTRFDQKVFPDSDPYHDYMLYSRDMNGLDIHGFSVAGKMKYEYGDLFSLSAEGTVQKQDGEKGWFNGYDRPKVTALFKAMAHPIKPLRINAYYDLRAKRAIYTRSMPGPGEPLVDGDASKLLSMRLPNFAMLGVGASWSFADDVSVWVQADNLLNRHDEWLPDLSTQGLSVVVGVKCLF